MKKDESLQSSRRVKFQFITSKTYFLYILKSFSNFLNKDYLLGFYNRKFKGFLYSYSSNY